MGNEMKDHQMEGILHQLQQSVEEWDTDKCPVVKAHVERKNPPAEVEAAAQKEGDSQDEPEETEVVDDTEDDKEEDGGEEENGDGDQGEGDNPEEPEDGDDQEENKDGEKPEETEDGDKAEENGGNKDGEDGGNEEENGDGETDGDDDIEGKIGAAPSLAASIAVMAGLLMISIA